MKSEERWPFLAREWGEWMLEKKRGSGPKRKCARPGCPVIYEGWSECCTFRCAKLLARKPPPQPKPRTDKPDRNGNDHY